MSSTILELTRSTHENVERFQKAIVDELDFQPKTAKETLILNARINEYLNRISQAKEKLANIYEDKDESRKEEITGLTGQGPTLYSMFYEKLRDIKEYHRKFQNLEVISADFSSMIDDDEVIPATTGEERYGKCLDLHQFHEKYQNLSKEIKHLDYYTYVENLTKFDTVPVTVRFYNKEYCALLKELMSYLVGFVQKAQPLFEWKSYGQELERIVEEKKKDPAFAESIEKYSKKSEFVLENAKKTKQKEQEKSKKPEAVSSTNSNSNDNSSTKPTVENNVPEVRLALKNQANKSENLDALLENPLYCQFCKKLFAKQTVFDAHLKGKKHLKAASAQKSSQEEEKSKKRKAKIAEVLLLEHQIASICQDLLVEQIDNTKTHITKKMARTYKEIEEDILREEYGEQKNHDEYEDDDDDDEEEAQIKTTIENYPIGWDGKPIPYWLYKLHGLGVEYKCEICGGASYYGRKAFEKHFQEWKHAHGMRCLGIPNTKHFQDITRIQDAVSLWEKICADNTAIQFKAEAEEEFEDNEGNVFNKKTYDDLKRQGLIDNKEK